MYDEATLQNPKDRIHRPTHCGHERVVGIREYVRGMTHTNGIESLWSLLKRAYIGGFRHFRYKHLHRYVTEATSKHNVRQLNIPEQLRGIVRCEFANRLPYADIIGPKHPRQPALIKNWE